MPWAGNRAAPERYWRVRIEAPDAELEAVASWLIDFGVGGVAFEDGAAVTSPFADGVWRPHEASHVTAYFPDDETWAPREAVMRGYVSQAGWRMTTSVVATEDWETAWKAFYQPVSLKDGYGIVPAWYESSPFALGRTIWLDPGMAFGTGTHATTQACLSLLIEHGAGKARVLDLGAGSGVLAIQAALLGATRVTAVEPDRVAVEALRHNIHLNGLDTRISVTVGTFETLQPDGPFDIVLMNLIRELIVPLWPQIKDYVSRYAILSGILESAIDDVERVVEASGFHVAQYRVVDGWATLRVVR